MGKRFMINMIAMKVIVKFEIDVISEYRDVAHNIYNSKYSLPIEITTIFYNEPNSDYRFIIKELAEEFKVLFTSLGATSLMLKNT